MLDSSLSSSQKSGVQRFPCLILALISSILGVVGIGMLFMKDYRAIEIDEYNHRTKIWNTQGINEMNSTSFSVLFGNDTNVMTPVTDGFGEFYPYRDPCDKDRDMLCEESQVLYYHSYITSHNDTEVLYINSASPLYNQTVIPLVELNLTKKDLNCIGGNEQSCVKECEKAEGQWESNINRCHLSLFLRRICLRIRYSNNSWTVDSPPQWSLNGSPIHAGCEYSIPHNLIHYIDESKWPTMEYSSSPSELVEIQLRHYQDPYIAASSLTSGCSTSTTENAFCFGKSKEEKQLIAILFIALFLLSLILLLFLFILNSYFMKKKGFVPSWLQSFQWKQSSFIDLRESLSSKELKDTNNDTVLSSDMTIDSYLPVLQRREDYANRSFQLGNSIILTPELKNVEYTIEESVFEGDEDGI